ncbi:hypothetical protein [Mucilaginibacter celer]|uniref:DUF4231 domain-containing protein n=1 Tax=Mucilaginibacter celer TaxID=2305508 RepID=A0A494VMH9_9SPHI|nr:hypothetical protein [Mucilaginibacter celer]AYL96526.1 hypothetical protein HYN43_015000 [Mucilaginibacter celer]
MELPNSSQETWKHKIREFFWPKLEIEENDSGEAEDALPTNINIVIENENLDLAYNLVTKFADSEDERRKSIESKANLFLSTVSIATTLVVASNTLLAGNNEKSWPVLSSVGISFVLTLYTIRTVWFSVKALGRGSYNMLAFDDLNMDGNATEYKKKLILALKSKTEANYNVINDKVDNVTMAQEYYKRAIVVIALYAFLIFMFCLFYSPPAKKDAAPVEKTINIRNSN